MSRTATPEELKIANHICEQLKVPRTLTDICKNDEGMPPSKTFHYWVLLCPEIMEMYEEARKRQVFLPSPVTQSFPYSHELAVYICQQLATPRTLKDILDNDPGMPDTNTVSRWVLGNPEFKEMYHAARILQANSFADEVISLSDKVWKKEELENPKILMALVTQLRVQVDTRKWYVAKVLPHVYGNNLPQDLVDKIEVVLKTETETDGNSNDGNSNA